MKERARNIAETGRGLLTKMKLEGTQTEVDKYSLHVEEVDKITSLILGLSSRLAKTESTLATLKQGTWDEDEEVCTTKRRIIRCIKDATIDLFFLKKEGYISI